MNDLAKNLEKEGDIAADFLEELLDIADLDGDIDMDGLMLFSLFVGVVAFTLFYIWMMMHRTRVMAMEDLLDDRGLDEALLARRQEAVSGRQSRENHEKGDN